MSSPSPSSSIVVRRGDPGTRFNTPRQPFNRFPLLVAQQAMEAEPTTAEAPAVEAALADAPVDRTFTHTFTPVSGAWADADDEEEEVGGARARHMEEMQEKYKSRSDRFGTALKEPSGVHSLDSALGGGSGGKGRGAAPRLSRLELMAKRREEATKKNRGFATGFDILSEEESRKREERAARYGAALLGDAPSEAPLAVFEEAAAKRAARAAKFGRDAAAAAGGVEVGADVLEPRRDALGDAEVRHECVYLYGVDTMSTKDCTKYFADFSPVFVEWINDSSCNVVFADAYTAKRAMHGTGTQEAPTVGAETAAAADDAAPMEGGDAAAQPHPECAWRKGVDFIKADGSHIPLCFRLATTDDVKPDGETVSRYLWCGGARPPPPARRGRASAGKKRRRRRDDDEGDGDGDVFEEGDGEAPMDAQAEQAGGDLREELKRRRAAAPEAEVVPPAVDAPMDVGEQAAQDAASVVTVPAVLPPGDLRVRLEHGLVPDFGNDGL